ncbi:hypothetical protein L198_07805 [Cryptococcus wingfieldii CBS 7118]|uniref:Uncharacterized protein n=1 Tax=Cryptococcus wingfieldii CBS 7118 TaxID=1295528 RepID=A0A1E3HX09_9TREE|nr:hypothetical protein L198_07805 [Cryptococcus wingfieldii CBS 7118]ODN80306.1 hypothetical protein L198_07805 [Cryptococcus wingfieldii CBS 7118]
MSKSPFPQDQQVIQLTTLQGAAQGSASLTTSSPVHSQQQQLAFSGDIEASAGSSTVGPHPYPYRPQLTDPNPQGDKAAEAEAVASVLPVLNDHLKRGVKQQQVAHPPEAMESMEGEGGLEGDDERGQPSGTVATEDEEMDAKCTSISNRSSLTPAAQPQANPHEFSHGPWNDPGPLLQSLPPRTPEYHSGRSERRPGLQLRGHTPNDREGDYGSQRPLDSTTLLDVLQAPPAIPQEQQSRAPKSQKPVHKLPNDVIQVEECESSE